ncbi:HD family phosphohydrolase [Clostridium sp. UBA4548]|uniref:HD family phosphohydrolase n=1 Tax=Clostridium sp. UBA4548 TaxID=1946361 RepID=UPI0025BF7C11|nr:HDIG domain-containing metalloprotein [Clostridium sp. UBA4548]
MGYTNLRKINLSKTKPYMIFLVTILLVYFTLSSSLITTRYDLAVGDIAKIDIRAPKDIEDEITTQKNIEQALKHVQDMYSYDANVKKNAIQNIEGLFNTVKKVNKEIQPNTTNGEEGSSEKLQEERSKSLREQSPIGNLSLENYNILVSLDDKQLDSLSKFLTETIGKLFDTTVIYENKPQDMAVAQGVITTTFNNSAYSKSIKDLGMAIGYTQVKPNYFIDHEKTEELRQEASKGVKPVIIKKDQTIVSEGEPITQGQIDILKKLGLLNQDRSFSFSLHISLIAMVLAIVGLQWIYLKGKNKSVYLDQSKLILINFLTLLTVILGRTLGIISPYIIPFSCMPILLSILIEDKVAIVISALNVIFIAFLGKFSIDITLIALINVITVPIILKKVQQRNDIIYSALFMAIVNIVFTAIIGYFLSSNMLDIAKKSLTTGISALVSGILAIGILPFLENIFDLVTNIKLLELSNPNHPLMKRLLLEAPGTYHHSVLVANLAEMAAESIGANAVLARVSAYYHDVGKLERPYYFKENQVGIDNPHDKIEPALSSSIILSHVVDGVRLGKKYGLPQAIVDIVGQHHGDSLVKYFYITMKNNSENPEDVKEEDYKYKGPAPTTREGAIVMLADSVEAAVRSIQGPTKEKIEIMVDNIIKGRLEENQLSNSELTFRDIKNIREAFLKVLSGIYHERIEYPKEKGIEQKKE